MAFPIDISTMHWPLSVHYNVTVILCAFNGNVCEQYVGLRFLAV